MSHTVKYIEWLKEALATEPLSVRGIIDYLKTRGEGKRGRASQTKWVSTPCGLCKIMQRNPKIFRQVEAHKNGRPTMWGLVGVEYSTSNTRTAS